MDDVWQYHFSLRVHFVLMMQIQIKWLKKSESEMVANVWPKHNKYTGQKKIQEQAKDGMSMQWSEPYLSIK